MHIVKRAFVTALAVALLTTFSPAHAASTVLTDPEGDATVCHSVHSYQEPACPIVDPYLGSDPTVDIVSFEIGTSATADLVAEITVVNLDDWWVSDHYKRTGYSVRFRTPDWSVDALLSAVRVGDATNGYFVIGGANSGSDWHLTPVTFDTTTNTIRWELSYEQLNDVLDEACSSCTDFAPGTTVVPYQASAAHIKENRIVLNSDEIWAPTATYDLGD